MECATWRSLWDSLSECATSALRIIPADCPNRGGSDWLCWDHGALRGGRESGFARLLLASMLQTTLGAAFIAVLPDPLLHITSPPVTWRIVCGAFGLYHLGIFSAHLRRQRSLAQMSAVQKVVTIASVPVIALKLAVGRGFLLNFAYPIYYLGLIWLLAVGCYAFVLILFDDGNHSQNASTTKRRRN